MFFPHAPQASAIAQRSRRGALALVLCVVLLGGASACGGGDPEAAAVSALSRFLEAMDRTAVNEQALEEAYALVDQGARRSLTDRAEQAALVGGHTFAPWQMLAQGRFRLRFSPAERTGMRARVTGDHAIVSVTNDDGSSKADVPLVREAGQWHVQLVLPPLVRVSGNAVAPAPAPATEKR